MARLAQNRVSEVSDSGLHIRRIGEASHVHVPPSHEHRDDYYIFCLVEKGMGWGMIDFKEQHFEAGDFFMILPGESHRFVDSDHADGWLLIADSGLVDSSEQYLFEKWALHFRSFKIDSISGKELDMIASILHDRVSREDDRDAKKVAVRLAKAFIGIVAEMVKRRSNESMMDSSRQTEIVLSFRRLLSEYIHISRKPSYYASMLNISSVYLNEVLNEVTGMSTTGYIRNEILLRAKRLLFNTSLTIKEVSYELGIEDYAYFTRLFTKGAGMSPSEFRRQILD